MSDQELQSIILGIAANDDEGCLKTLYYYYFDRLYRMAFAMVKSAEEAEEIVDDTFLSIWSHRKTLLEVRNFNVYIYTITRNKAINTLSAHKIHESLNSGGIHPDLFIEGKRTDDQIMAADMAKVLRISLERLPHQSRAVFRLVREDGLKYREAAEILNLSVKSIEYHMGNSLKKIWETFTEFYDASPKKSIKNKAGL